MPRVWNVVLEMVGGMRPVIAQVERHDPEMARKVRRAVTNVALAVAQGMAANENDRAPGFCKAYCTALGSAREAETSVERAHALGYARVDRTLIAQLREITVTLARMVDRRSIEG